METVFSCDGETVEDRSTPPLSSPLGSRAPSQKVFVEDVTKKSFYGTADPDIQAIVKGGKFFSSNSRYEAPSFSVRGNGILILLLLFLFLAELFS